jgi:hypothetical protein
VSVGKRGVPVAISATAYSKRIRSASHFRSLIVDGRTAARSRAYHAGKLALLDARFQRVAMSTVAGAASAYCFWIALGKEPDWAIDLPARVARIGKEDLVRIANRPDVARPTASGLDPGVRPRS